MDEISFSVIVPCYNVEKYVVHCVEKLQQQTFKDMEIILIDDGSTDHTFELCKEISDKYDNVVSITHDYSGQEATRNRGQEATRNRGLEATRNRGLEATRGKWVCFLDADDELMDDALQCYKETFEHNPDADMILTGLAFVYEDGTPERNVSADIPRGIYSAKEIAENALSKIPWPVMSCIGTKIYRREFIENNNLRFDISYKFNEDGAFAIKALSMVNKIAYIPKPTYRYLQRSGSIMHSYRNNAFDGLNRVNILLKDYFEKYGLLSEKEVYLAERQWNLIQSILIEEANYKDYKSFKLLFDKMTDHKDNKIVFEDRSFNAKLSSLSKIRLFMFCKHMRLAIFLFIKIRGMI